MSLALSAASLNSSLVLTKAKYSLSLSLFCSAFLLNSSMISFPFLELYSKRETKSATSVGVGSGSAVASGAVSVVVSDDVSSLVGVAYVSSVVVVSYSEACSSVVG